MSTYTGVVEGFRARSGEKTFLDRLDDLRGRLIRAALLLVVAAVGGFYLSMTYDVLGIFIAPIEPYLDGERLKYLSPMTPFFVTLKMGVFIGVGLALPYLLWQVWALLSPLMLPDERKLMAPALVAGVVLFIVGLVFCYYLVIPAMLSFTMNFQVTSLEQSIVIDDYFKLVFRMLILFGVAFQLPIAVLLATVLGFVTPTFLAEKRRHAIAIITIVGAIVTPPDIGSLLLLLIPVLILYEASIWISRLVTSRRSASLAAEGM